MIKKVLSLNIFFSPCNYILISHSFPDVCASGDTSYVSLFLGHQCASAVAIHTSAHSTIAGEVT